MNRKRNSMFLSVLGAMLVPMWIVEGDAAVLNVPLRPPAGEALQDAASQTTANVPPAAPGAEAGSADTGEAGTQATLSGTGAAATDVAVNTISTTADSSGSAAAAQTTAAAGLGDAVNVSDSSTGTLRESKPSADTSIGSGSATSSAGELGNVISGQASLSVGLTENLSGLEGADAGNAGASPAASAPESSTASSASSASPVAGTAAPSDTGSVGEQVREIVGRFRQHLWTYERSAVAHLHADLDRLEDLFE